MGIVGSTVHAPVLRAQPRLHEDDDEMVPTTIFLRDDILGETLLPIRLGSGLSASERTANVFLTPPSPDGPPLPWDVAKLTSSRRARGKRTVIVPRRRQPPRREVGSSLVAHVTVALAMAIAVGLYCDVNTRHRVAADLAQATRAAAAFVLQKLPPPRADAAALKKADSSVPAVKSTGPR